MDNWFDQAARVQPVLTRRGWLEFVLEPSLLVEHLADLARERLQHGGSKPRTAAARPLEPSADQLLHDFASRACIAAASTADGEGDGGGANGGGDSSALRGRQRFLLRLALRVVHALDMSMNEVERACTEEQAELLMKELGSDAGAALLCGWERANCAAAAAAAARAGGASTPVTCTGAHGAPVALCGVELSPVCAMPSLAPHRWEIRRAASLTTTAPQTPWPLSAVQQQQQQRQQLQQWKKRRAVLDGAAPAAEAVRAWLCDGGGGVATAAAPAPPAAAAAAAAAAASSASSRVQGAAATMIAAELAAFDFIWATMGMPGGADEGAASVPAAADAAQSWQHARDSLGDAERRWQAWREAVTAGGGTAAAEPEHHAGPVPDAWSFRSIVGMLSAVQGRGSESAIPDSPAAQLSPSTSSAAAAAGSAACANLSASRRSAGTVTAALARRSKCLAAAAAESSRAMVLAAQRPSVKRDCDNGANACAPKRPCGGARSCTDRARCVLARALRIHSAAINSSAADADAHLAAAAARAHEVLEASVRALDPGEVGGNCGSSNSGSAGPRELEAALFKWLAVQGSVGCQHTGGDVATFTACRLAGSGGRHEALLAALCTACAPAVRRWQLRWCQRRDRARRRDERHARCAQRNRKDGNLLPLTDPAEEEEVFQRREERRRSILRRRRQWQQQQQHADTADMREEVNACEKDRLVEEDEDEDQDATMEETAFDEIDDHMSDSFDDDEEEGEAGSGGRGFSGIGCAGGSRCGAGYYDSAVSSDDEGHSDADATGGGRRSRTGSIDGDFGFGADGSTNSGGGGEERKERMSLQMELPPLPMAPDRAERSSVVLGSTLLLQPLGTVACVLASRTVRTRVRALRRGARKRKQRLSGGLCEDDSWQPLVGASAWRLLRCCVALLAGKSAARSAVLELTVVGGELMVVESATGGSVAGSGNEEMEDAHSTPVAGTADAWLDDDGDNDDANGDREASVEQQQQQRQQQQPAAESASAQPDKGKPLDTSRARARWLGLHGDLLWWEAAALEMDACDRGAAADAAAADAAAVVRAHAVNAVTAAMQAAQRAAVAARAAADEATAAAQTRLTAAEAQQFAAAQCRRQQDAARRAGERPSSAIDSSDADEEHQQHTQRLTLRAATPGGSSFPVRGATPPKEGRSAQRPPTPTTSTSPVAFGRGASSPQNPAPASQPCTPGSVPGIRSPKLGARPPTLVAPLPTGPDDSAFLLAASPTHRPAKSPAANGGSSAFSLPGGGSAAAGAASYASSSVLGSGSADAAALTVAAAAQRAAELAVGRAKKSAADPHPAMLAASRARFAVFRRYSLLRELVGGDFCDGGVQGGALPTATAVSGGKRQAEIATDTGGEVDAIVATQAASTLGLDTLGIFHTSQPVACENSTIGDGSTSCDDLFGDAMPYASALQDEAHAKAEAEAHNSAAVRSTRAALLAWLSAVAEASACFVAEEKHDYGEGLAAAAEADNCSPFQRCKAALGEARLRRMVSCLARLGEPIAAAALLQHCSGCHWRGDGDVLSAAPAPREAPSMSPTDISIAASILRTGTASHASRAGYVRFLGPEPALLEQLACTHSRRAVARAESAAVANRARAVGRVAEARLVEQAEATAAEEEEEARQAVLRSRLCLACEPAPGSGSVRGENDTVDSLSDWAGRGGATSSNVSEGSLGDGGAGMGSLRGFLSGGSHTSAAAAKGGGATVSEDVVSALATDGVAATCTAEAMAAIAACTDVVCAAAVAQLRRAESNTANPPSLRRRARRTAGAALLMALFRDHLLQHRSAANNSPTPTPLILRSLHSPLEQATSRLHEAKRDADCFRPGLAGSVCSQQQSACAMEVVAAHDSRRGHDEAAQSEAAFLRGCLKRMQSPRDGPGSHANSRGTNTRDGPPPVNMNCSSLSVEDMHAMVTKFAARHCFVSILHTHVPSCHSFVVCG